jgi:hypothetical protein
VSGRKAIDIVLQPETKALGDVVVVGYGKQKKVILLAQFPLLMLMKR